MNPLNCFKGFIILEEILMKTFFNLGLVRAFICYFVLIKILNFDIKTQIP